MPAPASARKRDSARKKTKRTQAERSAITREKVIEAVIDCIVEEGFNNTTAARIAARAGVTWGAIAHQFGDKDSLLFAVVERNGELMAQHLAEALSSVERSPRERVSLLIDLMWSHINRPSSQAFNQLIVYGWSNADPKFKEREEELTVKLTQRIWQNMFGDLGLDRAKLESSRILTAATLLGMSIQASLGSTRPDFRREIAILKNMIADLLDLPPEGTQTVATQDPGMRAQQRTPRQRTASRRTAL